MTVAKLPADLPLAVAEGSDLVVALTVTEGVTPFDFTGVTVTTIIYQSDGDVSAQNFTTSTAGNVLTLTLSNATTTALGAGSFRYELRATEAGVVSPWVSGNLKVVNRGYGGSSSASASLSITTAPTVSLTISGGVQGVQGVQGDPGEGVAMGGSTGQVLAKTSGTNYATAWEDRANPRAETSGTCIPGMHVVAARSLTLNTVGRPTFHPFTTARTFTITDVRIFVQTAAQAGGIVRLGLYSVPSISGSSSNTLTLVSDFGTVLIDTTGEKTVALGTPLVLNPGVMYVSAIYLNQTDGVLRGVATVGLQTWDYGLVGTEPRWYTAGQITSDKSSEATNGLLSSVTTSFQLNAVAAHGVQHSLFYVGATS